MQYLFDRSWYDVVAIVPPLFVDVLSVDESRPGPVSKRSKRASKPNPRFVDRHDEDVNDINAEWKVTQSSRLNQMRKLATMLRDPNQIERAMGMIQPHKFELTLNGLLMQTVHPNWWVVSSTDDAIMEVAEVASHSIKLRGGTQVPPSTPSCGETPGGTQVPPSLDSFVRRIAPIPDKLSKTVQEATELVNMLEQQVYANRRLSIGSPGTGVILGGGNPPQEGARGQQSSQEGVRGGTQVPPQEGVRGGTWVPPRVQCMQAGCVQRGKAKTLILPALLQLIESGVMSPFDWLKILLNHTYCADHVSQHVREEHAALPYIATENHFCLLGLCAMKKDTGLCDIDGKGSTKCIALNWDEPTERHKVSKMKKAYETVCVMANALKLGVGIGLAAWNALHPWQACKEDMDGAEHTNAEYGSGSYLRAIYPDGLFEVTKQVAADVKLRALVHLEIDGAGHRPSNDFKRTKRIVKEIVGSGKDDTHLYVVIRVKCDRSAGMSLNDKVARFINVLFFVLLEFVHLPDSLSTLVAQRFPQSGWTLCDRLIEFHIDMPFQRDCEWVHQYEAEFFHQVRHDRYGWVVVHLNERNAATYEDFQHTMQPLFVCCWMKHPAAKTLLGYQLTNTAYWRIPFVKKLVR